MGGLIGGGGRPVTPPPVPSPAAIQTQVSPTVQAKAKETSRRLTAGRGRRGTILTQLTQDEDKRTVLG